MAIQLIGSFSGAVEAAKDIHECAFAGAAGAHDGEIFVWLDGEIDAIKSADIFAADAVEAMEILDLNERH